MAFCLRETCGIVHYKTAISNLSFLAPCVLLADLFLLLWCEVVLDIEPSANLLRCFALLDVVRDSFAREVEQGLDVEVVSRQDEREQRVVVNLDELSVPGVLLLLLGLLVLVVVGAVLEDELQDVALHSWEWDG